jgi:hypothetical protein
MSVTEEIGGEQPRKRKRTASGDEATRVLTPKVKVPLAAIIDSIRNLQRQRVYAIIQQSRLDRACEAFIAGKLGYHGHETPEKERKATFKRAALLIGHLEVIQSARRIFAEAERQSATPAVLKRLKKRVSKAEDEFTEAQFDPQLVKEVRDLVLKTADARAGFDMLHEDAETEMVQLADMLPVALWIKGICGFSLLGLAVIIGEAGDLGNYPNPGKLWKRLGLAPFNGRAASSWRRFGGLSKEEWKEVGFKPSRLGQIYGVVTAPLFFAKAKNVYGLVYAEAKARYDQRVIATADLPEKDKDKWTPRRADMAARRYMTKRLLRDLWRAGRKAAKAVTSTPRLPPASKSGMPQ